MVKGLAAIGIRCMVKVQAVLADDGDEGQKMSAGIMNVTNLKDMLHPFFTAAKDLYQSAYLI